jgi:hypothetical protein
MAIAVEKDTMPFLNSATLFGLFLDFASIASVLSFDPFVFFPLLLLPVFFVS